MDDTEIKFAGVKNRSGGPLKATHGGRAHLFEKDEVKVLEAGLVHFLLQRSIIASAKIEGTDRQVVTRKVLFEAVPLTEALKLVKEPENKSIAAAKKASEQKEKEKAAWKAEILAELKAEGALKK